MTMTFQRQSPYLAEPQAKRQPEGTLRDYQIDDLAFYIANPRCMNLSDPGTGKTPSVCAYTEYLWAHQQARTAWPMPSSLLGKNRKELLKFTTFSGDDVVIIDGTPEQRKRKLASSAKVKLMSFKQFSSSWKTLLVHHPDTQAVPVDEVHMGFKSHESARTGQLYKAMKKMKYYLPMSGTLLDGRLDAAYPTIHIIEPRYYATHATFLSYHGLFDIDGKRYGWENHEKIGRIFLRHSIRRSFESIFGKEAKVIEKRLCEMSPKQRAAYDEFEENALLELEDSFLSGEMPGVNAIRCRQIMAHPETFGLAKGELTGKDEQLLIDLADHQNSGKPFIIYSALVPEQERIVEICQKLGFKVGLINGNVSPKKRSLIDEAFIRRELDGIVGSPATATVGFNWGFVDHVIAVSLDYMNSTFVQAYRRAIRGKRETPLRISVYEYVRSVDQRIFQIVDGKSKDAHKVDASYEALDLSARAKVKTEKERKNDFSLEAF